MRLSHLVGRTAAALRHRVEGSMAAHGATFPEFLILYVVATTPGCSQADLADQVGVERPTMSHHLERLERNGVVSRRRDEHDRRVVRVHPTAAGRRRLATLLTIVDALEADLNALLTTREQAVLHKALERIAAAAEAGELGPA
jgi:MarR family transcriptional regulator, transcriptional regulator for hemolysin